MGFIIHFYIIFGTNLLTQRPVQIAIFCLFQGFAEKEYRTESKRNETFARDIFGGNHARETSGPSQGTKGQPSREGGAPPFPGCAPTLEGSPWLPWPNSFPSGASSGPKKIIKNWLVNWTPFDIPFL